MPTQLLNDDIKSQIKEVFKELRSPVEILFFGQRENCVYCEDTRQLVEEVVALSDKLSLSIYDMDDQPEIASQYRVDKTPGLVIAGREGDQVIDFGVRYAGIPSGHEFSSLIHDLVLVSGRDSGLSNEAREFLQGLEKPVHLQVFVTPT